MITTTRAKTHDIPTIRAIAHTTWFPTFEGILSKEQIGYMLKMMYSVESLTEQMEIKRHHFFLAKENDQALGFISIELNYQNQPVAKIHKIYILPAAQGKGIGQFLMQKAEAAALKHNIKTLWLNVNRYNKALGFYEKLGYKNIQTEDIDIGNGYLMEDYVLEKNYPCKTSFKV